MSLHTVMIIQKAHVPTQSQLPSMGDSVSLYIVTISWFYSDNYFPPFCIL